MTSFFNYTVHKHLWIYDHPDMAITCKDKSVFPLVFVQV